MTRPNAAIVVTAIALLFAGLASWGIYSYLSKESAKSKATGQPILVAAVDMPIGAKITAAQLKTAHVPAENIPQGSFTAPQQLEGRIVVRQLTAGDTITEQKLMPKEGASAAGVMTYIVPQGHRAVTVGVNEVAGVAGFLAPNNRVDVVLTAEMPNTANSTISKIVLQNVPILATGQITEQKEGKPVIVPTVTLDLTPDDAEKLVLASHKGSLQLLLRNIIDTAEVEAKGATVAKVISGIERPVHVAAAPAQPAKRAPRTTKTSVSPSPPLSMTVEIIKGKERTTKQFSE